MSTETLSPGGSFGESEGRDVPRRRLGAWSK